jgi:hypothetical protein
MEPLGRSVAFAPHRGDSRRRQSEFPPSGAEAVDAPASKLQRAVRPRLWSNDQPLISFSVADARLWGAQNPMIQPIGQHPVLKARLHDSGQQCQAEPL